MSNVNKVYKTSIVPEGSVIEPVRDHKMIASTTAIEVLHVLVFFAIIAFIFGGLWKAATKKKEVLVDMMATEKAKS